MCPASGTVLPVPFLLMIHEGIKKNLTRKSSGGHQAKRRKEEKPKPEEHEGMPQH
jgi:hypothetical protein